MNYFAEEPINRTRLHPTFLHLNCFALFNDIDLAPRSENLMNFTSASGADQSEIRQPSHINVEQITGEPAALNVTLGDDEMSSSRTVDTFQVGARRQPNNIWCKRYSLPRHHRSGSVVGCARRWRVQRRYYGFLCAPLGLWVARAHSPALPSNDSTPPDICISDSIGQIRVIQLIRNARALRSAD